MNPFDRLTSIAQEFRASRAALAALAMRLDADSTALRNPAVEPEHVRRALGNCERTFVVRLFAEFEALLREYWRRV